MRDFYTFANRYFIEADLVMKTALSVGAGTSVQPAGPDQPVMKTPDGVPFIPGSSLKGVVRSHLERLVRTLGCMGKTIDGQKLHACDPFSSPCVSRKCKDELANKYLRGGILNDAEFTCELWQQSCTICRLFGSPWLSSRLYFQDALLTNQSELGRLTEVRDGVGIDRDLGSARPKIKFAFEVVPRDSVFRLRVIGENLQEWEVGLLLVALQAMERGELPVGGKSTRGLGWAELRGLEVRRIEAQDLLDFLRGERPEAVSVQGLVQQFMAALERGGERHA